MISLVVMLRQETAAVDGVTTHTLAASHARAAACAAARAAGAMAERTERRKYFHVGPLPVGHAFSCSLPPLRHLLWSRLGKAAERFIASLGDVACASGQGCLLKDMLVQHALRFLSLNRQICRFSGVVRRCTTRQGLPRCMRKRFSLNMRGVCMRHPSGSARGVCILPWRYNTCVVQKKRRGRQHLEEAGTTLIRKSAQITNKSTHLEQDTLATVRGTCRTSDGPTPAPREAIP